MASMSGYVLPNVLHAAAPSTASYATSITMKGQPGSTAGLHVAAQFEWKPLYITSRGKCGERSVGAKAI
jgi:hypothetical protein